MLACDPCGTDESTVKTRTSLLMRRSSNSDKRDISNLTMAFTKIIQSSLIRFGKHKAIFDDGGIYPSYEDADGHAHILYQGFSPGHTPDSASPCEIADKSKTKHGGHFRLALLCFIYPINHPLS